ncbi:MAG: DUF861 domain-containing protein, partial [Mesorhizobium sp.]
MPGAGSDKQGVGAIVRLTASPSNSFVPPLSDYDGVSPGWSETEYRCHEQNSDHVTVGYWVGEPGTISFERWPYTEICSILTGKVGLRDTQGNELIFGPGEGFVVPKNWKGDWLTVEPATKFF